MPVVTYGRYNSYPYRTSLNKENVPDKCRALLEKLKQCENKVYPNHSNCVPQRAVFNLCLRISMKKSKFGK